MTSGTRFFSPVICLFSQLQWVSLCQRLWGFALARGGSRGGSSPGVQNFLEEAWHRRYVCVCECHWKTPCVIIAIRGARCRREECCSYCVTEHLHYQKKKKKRFSLSSIHNFPNRGIHAEQQHHLIHLQLLIHHDSVTNVTEDYFTDVAVLCGSWSCSRWFTYCHAFCVTMRTVDELNSSSSLSHPIHIGTKIREIRGLSGDPQSVKHVHRPTLKWAVQ